MAENWSPSFLATIQCFSPIPWLQLLNSKFISVLCWPVQCVCPRGSPYSAFRTFHFSLIIQFQKQGCCCNSEKSEVNVSLPVHLSSVTCERIYLKFLLIYTDSDQLYWVKLVTSGGKHVVKRKQWTVYNKPEDQCFGIQKVSGHYKNFQTLIFAKRRIVSFEFQKLVEREIQLWGIFMGFICQTAVGVKTLRRSM